MCNATISVVCSRGDRSWTAERGGVGYPPPRPILAENSDFIRKMLKPNGRGVGLQKILYTTLATISESLADQGWACRLEPWSQCFLLRPIYVICIPPSSSPRKSFAIDEKGRDFFSWLLWNCGITLLAAPSVGHGTEVVVVIRAVGSRRIITKTYWTESVGISASTRTPWNSWTK